MQQRHDIALSRRLYPRMDEHAAEFEALTQSLSIATFRYVPPDLRSELPTPTVEAYLAESQPGPLDGGGAEW